MRIRLRSTTLKVQLTGPVHISTESGLEEHLTRWEGISQHPSTQVRGWAGRTILLFSLGESLRNRLTCESRGRNRIHASLTIFMVGSAQGQAFSLRSQSILRA